MVSISPFYIILIGAFLTRVIHLNYNSAFNDEGIYIVIGRMGLFAHDWWSYGAKLWMAGLPYVYPPLSALAYELGGLSGARLLNVIFGVLLVEEVYRFTKLLHLYDKKVNEIAALIAAFLAAFSGIGIFLSKFATYDMPSFLLFMIGINSFLKAKYFANGKYYFLAFLCLFTAFLTKIVIAIFFPILFVLSLIQFRTMTSKDKKRMISYLYAPFLIAVAIYILFYQENILTFIATHKDQGKTAGLAPILSLIWDEVHILLLLFVPSAIGFIASKKTKMLATLSVLSFVIPVFHMALLRYATLDKHLYLTILFLSVIVGYGTSLAISSHNRISKVLIKVGIPIVLAWYLLNAQHILYIREHDWDDNIDTQNYLRENAQLGDKVLTQGGGAIILALYDKIFPPKNIVTFDWIDYSGLVGERGYAQAVTDGYFDFIELNSGVNDTIPLTKIIKDNLSETYYLAYKNNASEIYEKHEK